MSSSSLNPVICLGMPLYNSEKYVADAIKSLLNQSYREFQIIAVDDCSTDKSGKIVQNFAAMDQRVNYIKNHKRLGMITNWRKAFSEARKRRVDYFGWASDHDLWDPDWLQNHVNVLNMYPQVVATYPLKISIDTKGKRLPLEPCRFETFSMNKRDRVRAACAQMVGAGDMIYGLFRASVLDKCNVFPYFSMPDRLLLMQLSVHGTFKQIEKYLWYRRYFKNDSGSIFPDYAQLIQRQRSTLFLDNSPPWHSCVPALGQALGLILQSSIKPKTNHSISTYMGFYMAYLHLRTKKRRLKLELRLLLKKMVTSFFN